MSAAKESPPPLPTRIHVVRAKEPLQLPMGYSDVHVISRPSWIHHHHAHSYSSGAAGSMFVTRSMVINCTPPTFTVTESSCHAALVPCSSERSASEA